MSALQDIKTLLQQRGEHQSAIDGIDRELSVLRQALGMNGHAVVASVIAHPVTRRTKVSLADKIDRVLAVLGEKEPITLDELSTRSNLSTVTASSLMVKLSADGRVFRRRMGWGHPGKAKVWYARSEASFESLVAAKEEASGSDAEPG